MVAYCGESYTIIKVILFWSFSHCISGNAERVILYKIAFLTAKKDFLDCQKACVGNWECSVYVLHHHDFGNLELILLIKLVIRDCR